jgi:hypothetical protein
MQTIKFTTPTDKKETPAGPMCRLDAKPLSAGTSALAGTGAVSSAFMGFLV